MKIVIVAVKSNFRSSSFIRPLTRRFSPFADDANTWKIQRSEIGEGEGCATTVRSNVGSHGSTGFLDETCRGREKLKSGIFMQFCSYKQSR